MTRGARDLDAVLALSWDLLDAAVMDPRAPMRTPVVVSAGADGADGRVMVLRGSHRATAELSFHTDIRSPKVAALRRQPRVVIVGHDADRRVQLRIGGQAAIATEGDAVDAAWAATAAAAQRNYATLHPPGALRAQNEDALPATIDAALARRHFARLLVSVERIDWLELAASGHVAARFERDTSGWRASWRVP